MQLITITRATYLADYRIEADFSNGVKKVLDFAPIIANAKGITAKLADKEYFRNFTLDPFTIDWNNEIGFDPHDLYETGQTIGYSKNDVEETGTHVAEPQASVK